MLSQSLTLSRLVISGKLTLPTIELVHLFLMSRKSHGMRGSNFRDLRFTQRRWELAMKHDFTDFEMILINHLSLLERDENDQITWRPGLGLSIAKINSLLSFGTNADDSEEVTNCYVWVVVGTVGSPMVQNEAPQFASALKSRTLERYPMTRDWATLEHYLRHVYWDKVLAVNWCN
jgi:hypothetical protein